MTADADVPGDSLGQVLDALRAMASPVRPVIGDAFRPKVQLAWGLPVVAQFFIGYMTELHIVHTQMNGLGLVTGARVRLSLVETATGPVLPG